MLLFTTSLFTSFMFNHCSCCTLIQFLTTHPLKILSIPITCYVVIYSICRCITYISISSIINSTSSLSCLFLAIFCSFSFNSAMYCSLMFYMLGHVMTCSQSSSSPHRGHLLSTIPLLINVSRFP